jgi:general secretion pathway protein G
MHSVSEAWVSFNLPIFLRSVMEIGVSQIKKQELIMKKIREKKNAQAGFTLIELMVVIVILGILAGLIIPRIMGRPDEARQAKAKIQIEALESALKLYKLDNGTYPTTEQGLKALVEAPTIGNLPKNWRQGGYLEKGKVPKDPWDNEFVYVCPGSHGDFDLSSLGADGEPGGEGVNKDINNWEIE